MGTLPGNTAVLQTMPTAARGALAAASATAAAPACVDLQGWSAIDGTPCGTYAALHFCTPTGQYGAGWKSGFGAFSSWANNGISAVQACCACGGGSRPAGALGQATAHQEADGTSRRSAACEV